ncbi:MAG: polysaccharide biosynthesis protein [Anaerolineae bacterium]|nr:polysaccharide biosynthesis protein [Anaerolineae bacterium]
MTVRHLDTGDETYFQGSKVHRFLKRVVRYAKRVIPLALLDTVMMVAGYEAAYAVRNVTATINFGPGVVFFAYALIVTLVCMFVFGCYQRIWQRTSGHEVTVIIQAAGVALIIILITDMFFATRPLPLSVVLVGHALSLIGFVAVRYRSRLISGFSWRWNAVWHGKLPESKTRVLIVGAGDAGQVTAWRLKHRSPNGWPAFDVVGFVDDDLNKRGMYVEGVQVLGGRSDIPELTESRSVDLIVVAIHNISGNDIREILNYCEQTKARIKIVPDVFAVIGEKLGVPLLRDIQPEDLLGRQPVGRYEAIDITPVMGKQVLVTGAAGSIGSELCRQLMGFDPSQIILLDNNESGLHDLVTELKTKETSAMLSPVLADVTCQSSLNRVFDEFRPQIVFHAAAYKHVPMMERYPNEAIRVNVGGTWLLAQMAREYDVERFVLISTDKAVNPNGVMGASKRICELIMHALAKRNERQTMFTSVRFGNVLGSRGSVVPTFARQIHAGGPVTVTDKEMTRYFMTIPEAANLVIHAACLTEGDDLFMLRMGEVVRIVELAERMIRLRGLRPYEDIPIEFTGTRPGEKLHEELHENTESQTPTLHPDIIQLMSYSNGWQIGVFFDQLNQLLDTDFEDADHALKRLCAIINDSR